MPEYPRYRSKAQPTTQQPSFLAPQDPTGEAISQVGGAIGKGLQEIGAKWFDATNKMETAKAKANVGTGLKEVQLHLASLENPTAADYEAAQEKANSLLTENLEHFTYQVGKDQASVELGYDVKMGKIQLENIYKKKLVESWQAHIVEQLENTSDPEEVKDIMQRAIKGNAFSKLDGERIERQYVKKAKFNTFVDDMRTDMRLARQKLKSNYYGFDVNELKDAYSIYDSETNRLDEIDREVQNKTQADFTTAFITQRDEYIEASLLPMLNDPTFQAGKKFVDVVKASMKEEYAKEPDPSTVDTLSAEWLRIDPNDTKALMIFRGKVFSKKGKLDQETFKEMLAWTTKDQEKIAVVRPYWQRVVERLGRDIYRRGAIPPLFLYKFITESMRQDDKYKSDGYVFKGGRLFKIKKNPDGSPGFIEVNK